MKIGSGSLDLREGTLHSIEAIYLFNMCARGYFNPMHRSCVYSF